MRCHFLLQGIFRTQGLLGLLHCRQTLPSELQPQMSPDVTPWPLGGTITPKWELGPHSDLCVHLPSPGLSAPPSLVHTVNRSHPYTSSGDPPTLADRSGSVSFVHCSFSLDSDAHKTLCMHSKSRVSVFPSPVEVLQSNPHWPSRSDFLSSPIPFA